MTVTSPNSFEFKIQSQKIISNLFHKIIGKCAEQNCYVANLADESMTIKF